MRRRRWALVIQLLTLATSSLAGPTVRCNSTYSPTLNRYDFLCSDGTKGRATWSLTLQQWQTTITPPPGKTCTSRWDANTHQVVLNCQ